MIAVDRDEFAQAMARYEAAHGSELLRHSTLRALGRDPGQLRLPNKPSRRRRSPECARAPIQPQVPRRIKAAFHDARDLRPVERIKRVVAEHYDLDPAMLESDQRRRFIVHPRQAAMYLASKLTRSSITVIGRCFGGRDHTTVLHAIRAVEKRMREDPATGRSIRFLRAIIAPPEPLLEHRPEVQLALFIGPLFDWRPAQRAILEGETQ